MKRPVPNPSEMAGRALRRDMTVGTAALLLLSGTFVGATVAMGGPDAEPAETDLEEDPAGRAGSSGKGKQASPDTRVAASHRSSPLPPADPDDQGGYSPSQYGLTDADGAPLAGPGGIAGTVPTGGNGTGLAAGKEAGGGDGRPGALPAPGAADASATGENAGKEQREGTIRQGDEDQRKPATPKTPDADIDKPMTVRLGGDGGDVIRGDDGNDYIFGRDGDDLLIGGAGNDRLLGGQGNDVLQGGAGRDMLVGDKGDDMLSGGIGSDTFIFRAGFGHDTITDFNAHGERDIIEVAKSDFANFSALSASLVDTALGVTLTLHDGSTLTLSNVAKANLTSNDFHFEV